jgi:hypothetical protein
MDIVWQDSPGSFLDPTAIDGASNVPLWPGGDVSMPWYASALDGSLAASDGLLWAGTAALPPSGMNGFTGAGPDAEIAASTAGNGLLSHDILWANPSGTTSMWPINDGWVSQAANWIGGASVDGTLPITTAATGNSGPFQLWFAAALPSGNFTSPWDQALNVLWTGSGQPSVSVPASNSGQPASGNPLHMALPSFASMPPSQLVWTDPAASAGSLPGQGNVPSGAQPPLAAPTVTSSFPQLGGWTSALFGAHS